jgi:hypothetical protein
MTRNATFKLTAVAMSVGMAMAGGALAGDNDGQDLTYEVTAINEIAITDGSPSLTVNAAVAGEQPTPVTGSGGSYAITTNGTDKKITAAINTDMPSGLTLALTAGAPTNASANSEVSLSSTAAELVTGITQVAESGLALNYKLMALVTAGVVPSATKTVTLTITD